jgi:hypothetical protein
MTHRVDEADSINGWAELRAITQAGGLTSDGRQAVHAVLADLEVLLGTSWLRRQQAAYGGLPPELRLFAIHAGALPQFLSLGLRLAAATAEPSFARVRAELKRGLDRQAWRHLLLQLEVGRLATATGWRAGFEPPTPGSDRRADVVFNTADGRMPLVVETTSLFRSDSDREHHAYEEHLVDALLAIEQGHGVVTITYLTGHLDAAATGAWLREVDAAAALVSQGGTGQTLRTPAGTIQVVSEPPTDGTTFLGAPMHGDRWYRLARSVAGKIRQTSGWPSVWIRVDALDGLFQFTDWQQRPWPDRIQLLSVAFRAAFPDASHVAGVVVSSGLAVAPGATDPTSEDVTVAVSEGTGLRRTVCPHLVRETVILPLQADVDEQLQVWTAGYADERSWLESDLQTAGLPPLAQLWQY